MYMALPKCRLCILSLRMILVLQNAEDAAYLVKYLLNGTTGTPMKDMLRTVTRTFRSKPVDKKTVSVS